MKTYLLGVLVSVCMLPQLSLAYQVIDTSVTFVNEHSVLYTIKYQLGFEKYSVVAPIGAVASNSASVGSPYVQFELDANKSRISALVLSDAAIENNQYLVPQGESREFTLVVLMTSPTQITEAAPLQVTALPFLLGLDGQLLQNGLSAGELSYYQAVRN